MQVQSESYILTIDDRTGALRSLQSAQWPGEELLGAAQQTLPLFVVQYLDEEHLFRQVSSDQATACAITREETSEEIRVRLTYTGLGTLDADVHVLLRCPQDTPLSYWSCTLVQRSHLVITDIQFPFVVVPYTRTGYGPTQLLLPRDEGHLHRQPRPQDLQPDCPDLWQFPADIAHHIHYPGTTFAQFLAAYDARQGVYLGCHDATGQVKIIKPAHRDRSIRLGVAHVVGWDQPGEHALGYEVALGVFDGDWHAADLYRAWYESAAAPGPRLAERRAAPDWLFDSPLHVMLRIQGQLDRGPAEPNADFLPYEQALPLLDRLAEQVDAPLLPIVMGWERPGPWIYPDCFPVAGGDASLRAFTTAARQRGWHLGTYCNGTRWVIGHKWSGYDGEAYYRAHDGERSVCRLPDGTPWRETWDYDWRPSYMSCMAAPQTRQIAAAFVDHLLDLGLDWIQFLDQNCGGAAFPCYGAGHGHAPAPGGWMTEAVAALLAAFEERAAATGRPIVFSVESGANDHDIGHYSTCGIWPDFEGDVVPLYHYLFHEYTCTQAAFAVAPNPYWMEIKTALSFVLGDQPTAVMGPGGRLIAWNGPYWAAWDTPVGDQAGILTLLRRSIALRRGVGRDFLVFGRMLRPAAVQGIEPITWTCDAHVATLPAVFHARWRAPDGRIALALANWNGDEQVVRTEVPLVRGAGYRYHVQADALSVVEYGAGGSLSLAVPPRGVALLEAAETRSDTRR
jgi:hypothetical protein